MQFWSPTHTLNGISGLQNPIFSLFWRFLPVFSVRGVQKFFFDPKFFFSKNSTQSQFRTSYLDAITRFGKLLFISSENLKSHFPLFSNINWLQAEKWGPKTPGAMLFAWKVMQKLLDMNARDLNGVRNALNS